MKESPGGLKMKRLSFLMPVCSLMDQARSQDPESLSRHTAQSGLSKSPGFATCYTEDFSGLHFGIKPWDIL